MQHNTTLSLTILQFQPAIEYIVKYRRGNLDRRFPEEFLNEPLREIFKKAKSGDGEAQTARKLITDGDYTK